MDFSAQDGRITKRSRCGFPHQLLLLPVFARQAKPHKASWPTRTRRTVSRSRSVSWFAQGMTYQSNQVMSYWPWSSCRTLSRWMKPSMPQASWNTYQSAASVPFCTAGTRGSGTRRRPPPPRPGSWPRGPTPPYQGGEIRGISVHGAVQGQTVPPLEPLNQLFFVQAISLLSEPVPSINTERIEKGCSVFFVQAISPPVRTGSTYQ